MMIAVTLNVTYLRYPVPRPAHAPSQHLLRVPRRLRRDGALHRPPPHRHLRRDHQHPRGGQAQRRFR